jgi:fluoride exporter
MITALALVAGGVGAVARFVVSGLVQDRMDSARPWGTGVVNVTGAVALGVLTGLLRAGHLPGEVLLVFGAGMLGAYTTFSTWMVETVRLNELGGRAGALAGLANILLPLVIGLSGASLGWMVGGWL